MINSIQLALDDLFSSSIQKEEKISQVKMCIETYTPPEGILDYLVYLIQRVWNAVKSLFGSSDWQMSKEILRDAVLDKIQSKALIQKLSENENIKQKLEKVQDRTISYCLEEFLKKCVEANTKKDFEDHALLNLCANMFDSISKNLKEIADELGKKEPVNYQPVHS